MIRHFVLVALAVAVACAPARTAGPPPKTTDQRAREHAFSVVRQVLATRMSYLDGERRDELAGLIVRESVRAQFDPLLILALIEVESRFDVEAISPTGAGGLMQIVPSTWKMMSTRVSDRRLQRFDPLHNALVGIRYLEELGKTFIRPDSLLLAYNQGPGTASDVLSGRAEPTDEGRSFAPRVWSAYRKLLAENGLDSKQFRTFSRRPELTVLRDPSKDIPWPSPKTSLASTVRSPKKASSSGALASMTLTRSGAFTSCGTSAALPTTSTSTSPPVVRTF